MKKHLLLLSLLTVLSGSAAPKIKLHTLGDSTMEQQNPNAKDQRGWTQMLQGFFTDDLAVVNPAKSGTSTKTFWRNGFWAKAKPNIAKGDYVLIQFGHNDEKHNGRDGDTGTAPTDSFRIYLRRYVEEVRLLGATPILCTPVVRRMFDRNGQLSRRGRHDLGEVYQQREEPSFDAQDTLTMNYPANMKMVARELNCPLVDMTDLTARLVNRLGSGEATRLIYDLPNDGTHFGASGAMLFSKLFVEELQRQQLLTDYLRPDKQLLTNPSAIRLGELFVGTEYKQVFDVGCLGRQGKVAVRASEGFQLSLDAETGYADRLELTFSNAHFGRTSKLYLRTTPLKVGAIAGEITVGDDKGECNRIPIDGNVHRVRDGQPFRMVYRLSGGSNAEVEGAVSPLPQEWSGMERKGFNVLPSMGTQYVKTRVQENTIVGGVWPEDEIDMVYSRYIQFGLKASSGSSAHVQSVRLSVGGGSNFRIVASLDKAFDEAVTVGEAVNVSTVEMIDYSFPMRLAVRAGETLYLRIYPWGSLRKGQSLCLYNLVVQGVERVEK